MSNNKLINLGAKNGDCIAEERKLRNKAGEK